MKTSKSKGGNKLGSSHIVYTLIFEGDNPRPRDFFACFITRGFELRKEIAMNWLIYICGGWMWMFFWAKHLTEVDDIDTIKILGLITYLLSWIWICWKFFAEHYQVVFK